MGVFGVGGKRILEASVAIVDSVTGKKEGDRSTRQNQSSWCYGGEDDYDNELNIDNIVDKVKGVKQTRD